MSTFASTLAGILLAAPTPDELVRAYVQSIGFYDSVELELQFREECQAATRLGGVTFREGRFIVRRDGSRWRIEQWELNRQFNDEGRLESVPSHHEFVINGNGVGEVWIGSDDANNAPRYVRANLTARPDRETVGTADYFMILFGFNPGDGNRKSLIEVFRESALTAHEDTLNGRRTLRLDSDGPYGHASLWFDPAAGMQVCRLAKQKSGDDLLWEGSIASISAVPADRYSPGGKITRIESLVEVTKFGRWANEYFPEDVVITNTTIYENDQKAGTRYAFHVNRFKKGELTAADFRVTTRVSNGYSVQVDDQPNIEYEWRDGKIVKSISAEARQNLRAARFGTSFSIAAYFVTIGVLLLLAAAIAAWLQQRAASDR